MAEFEQDNVKLTGEVMRSLKWRLLLTLGSLVLERVAWSFWPFISWILTCIAIARLGLLMGVSQSLAIAVLLVGALGFVWLFAKGACSFKWPTLAQAKARLDLSLPGRPLEALEGGLSIGSNDAGTSFLWARHLQNMASVARGAKVSQPYVRLAGRDPWALRLIAVLLFAGVLFFGRFDPVESLVNVPIAELGPSWEGWAEPPAYTGKPAVYLNDVGMGAALSLPKGTLISLRVYGSLEGMAFWETVSGADVTTLNADESGFAEATFKIAKTGKISLEHSKGLNPHFDIEMIEDVDPQVALTDDIRRTVHGALQMPFKVHDDYGVIGGAVTIALALRNVDRRYGLALEPEPRDMITLDLPIPLMRNKEAFEETLIEDLAEHPWAGLPVSIRMTVRDEIGQTGEVVPEVMPMPGKQFFDPLAAAVAEQRRDLLWSRMNAARIVMILKAVTHDPETAFERYGEKPYLMIRTAVRRMEYYADDLLTDGVRDEVADLLWKAALLIEDGDLTDVRERLKRAQDRLSAAMKNGAAQQEIEELMNELRQSTREYMRQLTKEPRDNSNKQQTQNDEQRTLSQDQLRKLMDRIQEFMEQGRMAEAQELMDQLRQMMENMRVTESQNSGNQEAMQGLRDTLREQQDLADDTYRRLQEYHEHNNQKGQQEGQDQQDQGPNGEGQSSQKMVPGQLVDRQRTLREMLERHKGDSGLNVGKGFSDSVGEAQRKMKEAEQNLEEGNPSGALDNQADAMEALREGLRQLLEAQRELRSQQGTQSGQPRDPLGRSLSQGGTVDTNKPLAPTEDQYRRSREVIDEIRRRTGDWARPSIELDYLKRLLDRF